MLNGGTQSGLCVQMKALVGYVVNARSTNATLVLPAFSSHVANGHPVPFGQLFDADVFRNSLAQVGVTSKHDYDVTESELHGCIRRPPSGGGFKAYKLYMKDRPTSRASQQVEQAVLRGLVASRAIQERMEHIRTHLGLDAMGAYGCIHPRIEADMMLGAWHIVGEGPPPRLADYLRGVAAFPELRRLPQFYVAVGRSISRNDSALLTRHESGTLWPRLVRSGQHKVHHNGPSGRNARVNVTSSYIADALTDFLVCRDAAAFIGWSGSAFAQTIAQTRKQWYSTCPGRMELLNRWPLARTLYACSLASKRPCDERLNSDALCQRTGDVAPPLPKRTTRANLAELWDGGPVSP
jgi:hypothetical protein